MWLGSVLSNRMTRQVVGNIPLTNPVYNVLLLAPLFIYFSFTTGGGPHGSQPGSKILLKKPDVYIQTHSPSVILFQNLIFLFPSVL